MCGCKVVYVHVELCMGIMCVELCMYVELSDFFEINPCFDELNSVLPCRTSLEFSNRLNVICKMDKDSLLKLHLKQMDMALKIFSPVRESVIEEELLFSKLS